MFFGLTNSLATFQVMMNALYRETIQRHEVWGTMIRIYMDDIAIATKSPSLSLHTDAVSDVLRVAQENLLFFKLSKSIFHAFKIDYLGSFWERRGRGWTRPRYQECAVGLPPLALGTSTRSTVSVTSIAPLLQDSRRSLYPSMCLPRKECHSVGPEGI